MYTRSERVGTASVVCVLWRTQCTL